MCRIESVLGFTQSFQANVETGDEGNSIPWDVGTRRRIPDDSTLYKRTVSKLQSRPL
jgi:hypothetical protein